MEFPNIEQELIKGRGAQINTVNPFDKTSFVQLHVEGIDEFEIAPAQTEYFTDFPKKILNEVTSPDIGMYWSVNPYQGCEHGCIYCYARNTHNYWGMSAGIDFESKIMMKPEAPQLLEKAFLAKSWIAEPVSFSGNTDCYQPIEKQMQITKKLLEVCFKYKNPASIITKNQLIIRDISLLKEMAKEQLIFVTISITSLNESLRLQMEPRTATYKQRLKTIEKLAQENIPVSVNVAPIIPGLTDHEIPDIIKASAEHGAQWANMTMIRLNGAVGKIFTDWIWKTYPDKANKILNQIRSVHDGNLHDSRFGKRMKGDGNIAEIIHQLFKLSREKYFPNHQEFIFNTKSFKRPGQMQLQF